MRGNAGICPLRFAGFFAFGCVFSAPFWRKLATLDYMHTVALLAGPQALAAQIVIGLASRIWVQEQRPITLVALG